LATDRKRYWYHERQKIASPDLRETGCWVSTGFTEKFQRDNDRNQDHDSKKLCDFFSSSRLQTCRIENPIRIDRTIMDCFGLFSKSFKKREYY